MQNVPKIDFKKRLDQIFDKIEGEALLLIAQPQALRNSTVETPWRQESMFYYLTGFNETEAALLLIPKTINSERRTILFLRDKDPIAELWNGRRMGLEKAKIELSIDEAFSWEELWVKMPQLLVGSKALNYALGYWTDFDRKVIESLRKHKLLSGRNSAGLLPIKDSAHIGAEFRIIKSDVEIARMRVAANITKEAFKSVLQNLRPGQNEREIHGKLISEFLNRGSEMEAYGSIVAGGANACILHYRENNAVLKDGDLLLIDAGSQFDNYASDVTRTFPIGRKFTKPQRQLYEICLNSQKQAILEAKPGSNWLNVQNAAFRVMTQGLIDIGLIQNSLDEALEKNIHKHFCPHSISHWIGLDVHDAGRYMNDGSPIEFKEGMYFSVEPGIYIDASDTSVPLEYRGIGIRIEDDVLITKDGNEVLTGTIPKEIFEIER